MIKPRCFAAQITISQSLIIIINSLLLYFELSEKVTDWPIRSENVSNIQNVRSFFLFLVPAVKRNGPNKYKYISCMQFVR